MWGNENAAKLQLIFRSTKSEAQFCASTTDKAIQKSPLLKAIFDEGELFCSNFCRRAFLGSPRHVDASRQRYTHRTSDRSGRPFERFTF